MTANFAVAIADARVTARGDTLVDFLIARDRINGSWADPLVTHVGELDPWSGG